MAEDKRSRETMLFMAAILLTMLFAVGKAYHDTLQTIPNGSEHRMMIDVGETQAVLNTWGTLHATGYPLYVMTGNLITAAWRLLGVDGVTAAALVSLGWTVAALGLLALLIDDLTGRPAWGLAGALAFALTRFVWVHAVVAEIYSFGLLIQIALLWLAITPRRIRGRIAWLALLGGIGSAHHRGIGLMAPALIVAAYPHWWPLLRAKPQRTLGWLLLGVLGFLPYAYLPLRADAVWAYGELDTADGVWVQFRGEEADWFLHWPASWTQLWDNTDAFLTVIRNEVGLIGIVLGSAGLLLGLIRPDTRRPALMFTVAAGIAAAFSCVVYYDILATLVLTVTLALGAGVLLLMLYADRLLWVERDHRRGDLNADLLPMVWVCVLLVAMLYLFDHNRDFVTDLVTDPTGLETIALAENAPPDSTLMVAWGPRYFAVGVAQDVQDRLGHFRRVDHRADFGAILATGDPLVSPEYTFYAHPVEWWQARLGGPVFLQSAAPGLIDIRTAPTLIDPPDLPHDAGAVVVQHDWGLLCDGHAITLWVEWVALAQPTTDMSVLVHLLNAGGQLVGDADVSAPVYGRRPLTTWQAGEVVLDHYLLPPAPDASALQVGLYSYSPAVGFTNYNVIEIPLECPDGTGIK